MICVLPQDFRQLASAIRIDGERPEGRVCAALGADTEAVLAQAGLNADEIAALRRDGVI